MFGMGNNAVLSLRQIVTKHKLKELDGEKWERQRSP